MQALDSQWAIDINSGSIGIDITHIQDTAVPCPYN